MMSGSLALVVDEAGSRLEAGTHDTVVLVHPDGRRERLGVRALGSLVLHGDITLSTTLLRQLARNGVSLTVLPLRGSGTATALTGLPHRHLLLRHKQHLAYADPARRLGLALCVVEAKLNSIEASAGAAAPQSAAFLAGLRAASCAPDIATLMGVEGAASSRHFSRLAALYAQDGVFHFGGRSRPPADGPNALMSLSYTLAHAQANQLAIAAGLDAQLGFLHSLHRDRESLGLDLIEPARPAIDGWVLDLLAGRRLILPDMLSQGTGEPVRLTKAGRAAFYPLWFQEGHRIALRPMRSLLARILDALRSTSP